MFWPLECRRLFLTLFDGVFPEKYLYDLKKIADYSKQVKQRVTERMLFVHNLEEEVTYTFTVRAPNHWLRSGSFRQRHHWTSRGSSSAATESGTEQNHQCCQVNLDEWQLWQRTHQGLLH